MAFSLNISRTLLCSVRAAYSMLDFLYPLKGKKKKSNTEHIENSSLTVWIPEQPSVTSHISKTPTKLSLINSKYAHRLPERDQLTQKESVLFCKQLGYCGPIDILSLHCKISRRRSYIKTASNFR